VVGLVRPPILVTRDGSIDWPCRARPYPGEAEAWREWWVLAMAGDSANLQVIYGLDDTARLAEHTLDWLGGYLGPAPVRRGNAAAGLQRGNTPQAISLVGLVNTALRLDGAAVLPPVAS
jgi:hypothetical protein